MSRSARALVVAAALALGGCDIVFERDRDGVRGEPAASPPLPAGAVPRGQGAARAALQPPGPTVDGALLRRGRERYAIYCTPCHGAIGRGDGAVVKRGFPRPPSQHIERLRAATPASIVATITHGIGNMPSYAERIPPHDRWAIAHHLKASQQEEAARVGGPSGAPQETER